MEDDYYSILNLDRNCTEDDVKASYRRLCVHYHPDKHNPLNREAAEGLFQKIKKAYDVLIDPKTRTIFDIYGVEGLESDWSVTLKSMNQNEIREAYDRIERQKREEEEERATNPVSATSIEVDASGLLHSDYEIQDFLSLPINSFTISQSVDAPLTDITKANVVCTAINNDSIATGVIRGTVRHSFSPTCWLEPGLTLGHSPVLSLNGFSRLTNFLFCSVHGELIQPNPEIISYDAGMTVGCNLTDGTILKTEFMLDKTVKTSISRVLLNCNIDASYTLGLETQRLSLQLLKPIMVGGKAKDMFIEASIKSRATKNISPTNHNRFFRLTRVEPVAVVYGTTFPLFVYSALHYLVIKPYLNKKRAEDTAAKAEELSAWLETQREEARGAITLMKESYHKIVNLEQGKGGLIIMQAWYGVFGSANKLIDVTIPLQCLVHSSRLILPDSTKVIVRILLKGVMREKGNHGENQAGNAHNMFTLQCVSNGTRRGSQM
eukprot:sb/3464159/